MGKGPGRKAYPPLNYSTVASCELMIRAIHMPIFYGIPQGMDIPRWNRTAER